MKSKQFGFIGCGNLAQAIIRGALRSPAVRASGFLALDRSAAKLNLFAKQTKIKKAKNAEEVLSTSKYIFLATKPQDLLTVIREISKHVGPQHVIVSLAGGVEAGLIAKLLPQAGGIVRVMANTPVQVGEGVFGIYSKKVDKKSKQQITNFFSALGLVVWLNSDQEVDTITSGSASGVGFVFELMRIFEDWFIENNISKKQARLIVEKVFLGAGILSQQNPDKSLGNLREAVTSKKGTTLSGLRSMKKQGLQRALKQGLNSGKLRAKEISKSLRQNVK